MCIRDRYQRRVRGSSLTSMAVECAICLTDLDNGGLVTQLPCTHEFHRPCVNHPDDPNFRSIRCSNAQFQQRIGRHAQAGDLDECMRSMGVASCRSSTTQRSAT
eukprot:TRINITY_DN9551_c0_g1_i2.p1 TRINITY_DN9551_c0_g1~~TRINITY_DN9551_c0_g1_i2.p1  ORF type:complete len:104 (+),score=14.28 TRINITY_DN9551_c0_g1_i2:111-422(+)